MNAVPKIELSCNGEKIRGHYAIVSPAEIICRLELINVDEDSPHFPHVHVRQQPVNGVGTIVSPSISSCGKNAWQFSYKVHTYGILPEKIEIFVAHPSLRMIHTFDIDTVDESKGLFCVKYGHVSRRFSFTFEDGLQSSSGGFFPSFPPIISRRSTQYFRISCMRDKERFTFPEPPFLVFAPDTYKEPIAEIPGIRIGNAYVTPLIQKEVGLYEALVYPQMLPPDLYGFTVYHELSGFRLGHTSIKVLSDDELKTFNKAKRAFKRMLLGGFSEKNEE